MKIIPFPLWAVYFNPKDYPGKYVTRKFWGKEPTNEVYVADSLEEIRSKIPEGFCRLDRYLQDDPVIVETWI